ncbi:MULTISPECIES: ABC transporter ATP-binding protein [unclassified Nocardia]|uniref:ABC transporter ATP-binding protein n=1 Tax=unclassified Nocardia TaxID=2637762 RepID=UPI001CE491E2|nr:MULTISPECIES: ABC transporter ATP-binding protein [unclassified Nocardia]
MARIDLAELTKIYPGDVKALDGLEFTIADGEFFALLGPSGCGKTTLLRTIAGLETPTSGRILIDGKDVTRVSPGRRDVAMVFQDYALFPHMSVLDNIAYPLKIRGADRRTRAAKATETGDQLSLQGLLARRPAELSGGQQQRVALARAMACHPKVFLFDEPLSNLDARLRLEARTFLKKLQLELGVTTVFVTHDQAEALALADRIAVLDAGRIRQIGTARAVFRRPADTFVANFIGSTPMNLIPGELVGHDPSVIWGARPEYLSFSHTAVEGALHGVVAAVEHLGATSLVTVDATGFSVGVTVPETDEPALGAEGWVVPQADRVLLYDAESGALRP